MSSSELPDVPAKPLWARFSADPRTQGSVRASDADRDLAADVVNTAFQEGRLDSIEHSERLGAVLQAKTLGQLVPLLSDVTISDRPRRPVTPVEKRRSVALRSWLSGAVVVNLIWVATWLASGSAPYYYWPIWPMLGTAIPLIIAFLVPDREGDKRERGDQRELGH
ncbi:MAG: DUF1707 domain-containing protein [Propioniciclava sp.]|uniref:DUF1707 SHOCT-like domain-containing protein n=1 Tax=Propioniciclava sp. TaxID=2038686 RepID=UPI0039E6A336